jgi:ATP-dependent RNA helicase DeaD
MSTFRDLGVRKDYIDSLKELKIKNPTDIQEKTIPVLLNSETAKPIH